MRLSHVLLIAACVAYAQAFFLSLGLVGIGVAGLAGLKLYYGMKLFGPAFHSAREGFMHNLPGHSLLHGVEHQPAVPAALSSQSSHQPQVVVLPVAFDPKGSSQGVPVSFRVRRALPAQIQLSGKLLRWLREVDDTKCIHRFFCALGADPRNFGNLGRITNMVILMGGLPKDSWAQQMHTAGQDGKSCPTECDEKELAKTVSYLERHLFVNPETTKPDEVVGNSLAR